MSMSDKAWRYVKDVVAGNIVCCKYLKMACKKLLHEYEIRQHEDDYPWLFHDDSANHFLEFTKLCKYPDGLVAGKPVELHPWQLFTFAMAYGWRSKSDISIPRFNDIWTRIARKNDKTTGLSTVMIYEILTGPQKSEHYITAVNRDQASIAFKKCKQISETITQGLHNDMKTVYGELKNINTNATLVARSRENKASDGASCYRGYWDEAARIEDAESFDILHSSQGAWQGRYQNWYISTAQANRETLYYQQMEVGRRVLEGTDVVPDDLDRHLYIFYELDDESEWDQPDMWVKSNPSLGLSILQQDLEKECFEAKQNISKKSEFLRKKCNIYVASESPWIDVDMWNKLKVPELQMVGNAYMGIDMGKTSDLNAATILWCNEELMKFEAKNWAFIPRVALDRAPKHVINVYKAAMERGSLIVTPGDSIDEEYIEQFIRDKCSEYDIKEVAYDPYKSQSMMTKLTNEGLPMIMQRQGRISLGPGTSETEKIILAGQIAHDGDPFFSWQIANTQVEYDNHDLPQISKPTDYSMKIDNVTALVMAITRATVHGGLTPKRNYRIRFI